MSVSEQPDGPPAADHEAPWEDAHLLLETVLERSGLDFRRYAPSSLRRRIAHAVRETESGSISGLHLQVKTDDTALAKLIAALTVHTTTMFRDPKFFHQLRTQIVPILKTYPFIRIWIAGCSTGEEVYSLSILLREEGIADRCRIYATDVSDAIVKRAQRGVYPLSAMQEYSRNYQLAGGTQSLSEYFTADAEWVIFSRQLRDNVVFGTHNLVSDASFNEFHLVLCRNVMIYFKRELQEHVHRLLHASLINYGFLGLGRSETVRFTTLRDCYSEVENSGFYKKIK